MKLARSPNPPKKRPAQAGAGGQTPPPPSLPAGRGGAVQNSASGFSLKKVRISFRVWSMTGQASPKAALFPFMMSLSHPLLVGFFGGSNVVFSSIFSPNICITRLETILKALLSYYGNVEFLKKCID